MTIRSVDRPASASATVSIQVPTSEMIWPLKKSWKLRCFSERTISRNRERLRSRTVAKVLDGSVAAMLVQLYDVTVGAPPRLSPMLRNLAVPFRPARVPEAQAALHMRAGCAGRAIRHRGKEFHPREASNKTIALRATSARPIRRAPRAGHTVRANSIPASVSAGFSPADEADSSSFSRIIASTDRGWLEISPKRRKIGSSSIPPRSGNTATVFSSAAR